MFRLAVFLERQFDASILIDQFPLGWKENFEFLALLDSHEVQYILEYLPTNMFRWNLALNWARAQDDNNIVTMLIKTLKGASNKAIFMQLNETQYDYVEFNFEERVALNVLEFVYTGNVEVRTSLTID